MPKLPSMTARELVRFFERQGFEFDHQTGSHRVLKHADGRRATIPMHPGDLNPFLARRILSTSGFTVDDYLRLR